MPSCWPSARTRSRQLGIAGEEKAGVINGLDFLREVALEFLPARARRQSPKRENSRPARANASAWSAAATWPLMPRASRCGSAPSEVHVMYRRTGDDMPATHLPEEIEGALHEGVRFHTLVNPAEILGDERVTGVRLRAPAARRFRRHRAAQTGRDGRRKASHCRWISSFRPSARRRICRG